MAGADMTQFAQAVTQSFVNTAKGAQATLVSGTLSGAVPLTSPVVRQLIMEALNADRAPQSWLPAIELMISKESGGNAGAVDPISVLGQHAEGILQMLPSTFSMYGGTGSIFNPLENLETGIRYIMDEYGSPFNIQGIGRAGTYRGYSGGGAINEPVYGRGLWSGMGYSFAENGQSEYVSNGSQAAAGAGGSDQLVRLALQGMQNTLALIARQNAALPQNLASAVNKSSGAGIRASYYSAQA
jgi:SLT domain-containing protein